MIDFYTPIEFEFDGFYQGKSQTQIKMEPLKLELENDWNQIETIGAGLKNMGNTCYLNSIIQILNYTPCLSNFLQKNNHIKNCKQNGKSCALCLFSQNMIQCKRNKQYQPYDLINNMQIFWPKFKKDNKQDAYEFYLIFLKALCNSDDTLIKQIFQGKQVNLLQCTQCQNEQLKSQEFFNINISNNTQNLEKSINQYFQKQIINNFNCDECKKQVQISKQIFIDNAPNILVFHISKNYNSQGNYQYQTELDIQQFQLDQEQKQYELYGIVVHKGKELLNGHYYCYVKNSNKLWYKLNDETVKECSFDSIQKETPYMLFFRIKTQNSTVNHQDQIQINKISQLEKKKQLNEINDIFKQKKKQIQQKNEIKLENKIINEKIIEEKIIEEKIIEEKIIEEKIIEEKMIDHQEKQSELNLKRKNPILSQQPTQKKINDGQKGINILQKSQQLQHWGGSSLKSQRIIMDENQELFEVKKKEKDEYDKDYDKGKTKKIKKPKEINVNDFQSMYGRTGQIKQMKNKTDIKRRKEKYEEKKAKFDQKYNRQQKFNNFSNNNFGKNNFSKDKFSNNNYSKNNYSNDKFSKNKFNNNSNYKFDKKKSKNNE